MTRRPDSTTTTSSPTSRRVLPWSTRERHLFTPAPRALPPVLVEVAAVEVAAALRTWEPHPRYNGETSLPSTHATAIRAGASPTPEPGRRTRRSRRRIPRRSLSFPRVILVRPG